jgi:ubiquinone/menaquinone biosynthesis C-methylase UbiE
MAGKYIHGTQVQEQERLARLNDMTNKVFIDFLNISGDEEILECGSGLGILAKKISEKLVKGKITGLEISDEQLNECPPESKNLTFVKGDVRSLPFHDQCFDKVYCRYILEHVDNPLNVLIEAKRVLKPGGEIFIQENSILLIEFYPDCPYFKKLWKKFALLQSLMKGDAMIGIKLYRLVKEAGFVHIELSAAPEIHYAEKGTLVPWIDNLILNVLGVKEMLISRGLTDENLINKAICELEDFKKDKFASTYFYWNRAKAVKPLM